ncbi:MAG: WXG100 family type VII secretion target [Lachnospiraceae bacterium]|jgi:WXG100 family type VII secretion target|nr:WXG100 family type VII secretion target [Lachnospiraceae bacterium]
MEGILKVTPERLIEASAEFSAVGNVIRSLSEEMMQSVNALKGVWQGEAATMYGNRFGSLRNDMDRLQRMIKEHVDELQEMARQYQAAEAANIEAGNVVASNIIL